MILRELKTPSLPDSFSTSLVYLLCERQLIYWNHVLHNLAWAIGARSVQAFPQQDRREPGLAKRSNLQKYHSDGIRGANSCKGCQAD